MTLEFLLFFVDYRLSQYGVYRRPQQYIGITARETADLVMTREGTQRFGFLGAGLFGIAFGVNFFCQTVLDPGIGRAVAAGITSIVGYMLAHIGMNGMMI